MDRHTSGIRRFAAGLLTTLALTAGTLGATASASTGSPIPIGSGATGSVFGLHDEVLLHLDRMTTSSWSWCRFDRRTTEVTTTWGGQLRSYLKTEVQPQPVGLVLDQDVRMVVDDGTFHTPATVTVTIHGATETVITFPLSLASAKQASTVTVGVPLPGRWAVLACQATLSFSSVSRPVQVPPPVLQG